VPEQRDENLHKTNLSHLLVTVGVWVQQGINLGDQYQYLLQLDVNSKPVEECLQPGMHVCTHTDRQTGKKIMPLVDHRMGSGGVITWPTKKTNVPPAPGSLWRGISRTSCSVGSTLSTSCRHCDEESSNATIHSRRNYPISLTAHEHTFLNVVIDITSPLRVINDCIVLYRNQLDNQSINQ